jgi:surfeit locus 1 family protein
MIQFRPLPVLSVASAAALLLLVLLGNWQWARFQEKQALASAPPQELVVGPIAGPAGDPLLLYGVSSGKAGWRVLVPVKTGAEPTSPTILVDTGFVEGVTPPPVAARPISPALAQGVVLRGVKVTPSGSTTFTAKARPADNVWYAFDPEVMAAINRFTAFEPYVLALPYVGVDGAPKPNPFAHAGGIDPLPPERHAGYALTWWGLALALIGFYAAYHVRLGRLQVKR